MAYTPTYASSDLPIMFIDLVVGFFVGVVHELALILNMPGSEPILMFLTVMGFIFAVILTINKYFCKK